MTERIVRQLTFSFIAVVLFAIPLFSAAATASHIVISEVQTTGGTGATTDEFVELYNPTDAAMNLNGWSLTKKTAGGTASTLVDNLGDRAIPAHGYFLIAHPSGYTGAALPDVRYTTTGSLADDNTVILLDASAQVVDRIGFGSASDREGTAAPNPGAKKSVERKVLPSSTAETMAEGGADEFGGNGEDTDDNRADSLTRTAPEPQNSQSVVEMPSLVSSGPVTSPIAPPTPPTSTPAETSTAAKTDAPPPNRPPEATITPFESNRKVRDVLHFSTKDSSDPDRDSITFSWSFGDGEKATGRDVSHAYQKAGRFTLTLTVDDGRGGTDSATDTARITGYDVRRGVVVNELLPNPADDESNEWIELTNTSKDRIDLDGWTLLVNDKRYRLEPMIVGSGQFLLLSREQTKLALPNTGATLTLRDPDGQVVQTVEYGTAVSGMSFSRKSDATWEWMDLLTPGSKNGSVRVAVLGASVEKEGASDPATSPNDSTGDNSTTAATVTQLPGSGKDRTGVNAPPAGSTSIDLPPDDSSRRLLVLLAVVLAGSGVGLIALYVRKRIEHRRLQPRQ